MSNNNPPNKLENPPSSLINIESATKMDEYHHTLTNYDLYIQNEIKDHDLKRTATFNNNKPTMNHQPKKKHITVDVTKKKGQ